MDKRNYFVRLITEAQVKLSIKMLEDCAGRKFPVELSEGFVTIHAPDGDVVFQALRKGYHGKNVVWACKFHREVFDENNKMEVA